MINRAPKKPRDETGDWNSEKLGNRGLMPERAHFTETGEGKGA